MIFHLIKPKERIIYEEIGYMGCRRYRDPDHRNSPMAKCEEHLWDEIFFVDNWKPEDEEIYGARNLHFGTVKELFSPDQVEFVIALGEPRDRKLRFEEIRAAGYGFGKVIAPTARVSQSATLGEGFVALDGALVEPLSVVGDGVMVGDYAAVGHGSTIGNYCHVGATSNIGGDNIFGDEVFLGLHCATKQGIKIGNYSVIGMGGIVLNDVPENVVMAGVPAKKIKDRDDDMRVF